MCTYWPLSQCYQVGLKILRRFKDINYEIVLHSINIVAVLLTYIIDEEPLHNLCHCNLLGDYGRKEMLFFTRCFMLGYLGCGIKRIVFCMICQTYQLTRICMESSQALSTPVGNVIIQSYCIIAWQNRLKKESNQSWQVSFQLIFSTKMNLYWKVPLPTSLVKHWHEKYPQPWL